MIASTINRYTDRHTVCTVLFAGILSVACLLRGGVYDISVAILLLALTPLCLVIRSSGASTPQANKRLEPFAHLMPLFGCLLVIACLQPLLSRLGYPAFDSVTHSGFQPQSSFDHSGWIVAIGHFMLFSVSLFIALEIAQSKQLSRLFLKALLMTGLVCVFFTFFSTASYHYNPTKQYTHGFVNPNHAASYLGVLLCLAIWALQMLLRRISPPKRLGLVAWFDRLSLLVTGRLILLFFAILLFVACLFLTKSRAGVPIVLLSTMFLLFTIVLKKATRSGKPIVWAFGGLFLTGFIMLVMLVFEWFGSGLSYELDKNGIVFTTRPYVYAASASMIAENPLFGVGLGGYTHAFPQFRPEAFTPRGIIETSYNSFLQIGAEMGIPAMLIVIYMVFAAGRNLFINLLDRRKHYGFAALGLSVWLLLVLHSLIDFPMQIPAIGAIGIAVLTVCCCQSKRQSSNQPRSRPLTT